MIKEVFPMNNKGVGAVFCLIAAILGAAKYLTSAIYMSSSTTWSADLFTQGMSYTGSILTIAAIAALVIGLIFLCLGFVKDKE